MKAWLMMVYTRDWELVTFDEKTELWEHGYWNQNSFQMHRGPCGGIRVVQNFLDGKETVGKIIEMNANLDQGIMVLAAELLS